MARPVKFYHCLECGELLASEVNGLCVDCEEVEAKEFALEQEIDWHQERVHLSRKER